MWIWNSTCVRSGMHVINAHWLYCELVCLWLRVIRGLEYQTSQMSKHFALWSADYVQCCMYSQSLWWSRDWCPHSVRRLKQRQHLPSLRPITTEILVFKAHIQDVHVFYVPFLTSTQFPHLPVTTHCFQFIMAALELHIRLHLWQHPPVLHTKHAVCQRTWTQALGVT